MCRTAFFWGGRVRRELDLRRCSRKVLGSRATTHVDRPEQAPRLHRPGREGYRKGRLTGKKGTPTDLQDVYDVGIWHTYNM